MEAGHRKIEAECYTKLKSFYGVGAVIHETLGQLALLISLTCAQTAGAGRALRVQKSVVTHPIKGLFQHRSFLVPQCHEKTKKTEAILL